MVKYYRKQPVEAIQWRGDNQNEVHQLASKVVEGCYTADDAYSNLHVAYWDARGNKHLAAIPKLGWVVIEGKTLQFYKDKTFRHTFKAAEDDSKGIDWGGMTDTINKAFEGFDDIFKGFHGVPHKDIVDALNKKARSANISNGAQRLSDFLRRGCVSREEAERNLLGGVTFDSVLDEMKELHAKKNQDYKGSFHDLFKEYGMPYALGHLEEKLNRVKAITENGGNAVKNEHIEDSVIDMACYAVMLYVELKNKENGADKD